MTPDELMFEAYVECALWSSTDEECKPFDLNYDKSSISPETLARMQDDCDHFLDDPVVTDACLERPEDTGHDFWLTRNHHGAGFWDGNWPEEVGKILTDLSHSFGEFDLYIGDDGMIYGMGT
jgi:hypothetical protein